MEARTISQADQSPTNARPGSTASTIGAGLSQSNALWAITHITLLATTLLAYCDQRYWHIGNNSSVVWATTLLLYGQQQQRDIGNSSIGIWATTLLAYKQQQQRNSSYWHIALLAYAAEPISAYAPKRLMQVILNSNKNGNHNQSC